MEEDYKSLGMEKEYMEDVVIYNLNKFIEYCNTSHNFEYDYDFKQHKEVAVYIENLLTRYKQQKTELESVKEIYYTQTEMDNVMERYRKLVEDNKILKKGIVPSYENTIKELEEQLFDSIPKSKVKEIIENHYPDEAIQKFIKLLKGE